MKPSWLSDEQHQLRDMLHRLVADSPPTTAQLAEQPSPLEALPSGEPKISTLRTLCAEIPSVSKVVIIVIIKSFIFYSRF